MLIQTKTPFLPRANVWHTHRESYTAENYPLENVKLCTQKECVLVLKCVALCRQSLTDASLLTFSAHFPGVSHNAVLQRLVAWLQRGVHTAVIDITSACECGPTDQTLHTAIGEWRIKKWMGSYRECEPDSPWDINLTDRCLCDFIPVSWVCVWSHRDTERLYTWLTP